MRHTVRVEPAGIDLACDDGQTVMAAAHDAGFYWPTVCGGEGSCHTCFVRVVGDDAGLAPPGAWEREGLAELAVAVPGDDVRLACQAKVRGDVTVRKPGVRRVETVKGL